MLDVAAAVGCCLLLCFVVADVVMCCSLLALIINVVWCLLFAVVGDVAGVDCCSLFVV